MGVATREAARGPPLPPPPPAPVDLPPRSPPPRAPDLRARYRPPCGSWRSRARQPSRPAGRAAPCRPFPHRCRGEPPLRCGPRCPSPNALHGRSARLRHRLKGQRQCARAGEGVSYGPPHESSNSERRQQEATPPRCLRAAGQLSCGPPRPPPHQPTHPHHLVPTHIQPTLTAGLPASHKSSKVHRLSRDAGRGSINGSRRSLKFRFMYLED